MRSRFIHNELLLCALCLVLFACAGCGTIVTLVMHKKGDDLLYSGGSFETGAIMAEPHPHNVLGGWPTMAAVLLVDLPFSLVLDTLLLPVTGAWAVYDRFFDSRNVLYYIGRNNLEMIRRSLRQPFLEVNYADESGRTALHCAVSAYNEEAVRMLIAAGAAFVELLEQPGSRE